MPGYEWLAVIPLLFLAAIFGISGYCGYDVTIGKLYKRGWSLRPGRFFYWQCMV